MLLASPLAAQPDYIGAPEIVRTEAVVEQFSGVVFHDQNGDGKRSEGEPGVADVLVSNGRELVRTDSQGRYSIAAINNHDLTIVQPSGWRVPTDARWVPQFSYIHKPGGTGYELRYGGLPDTGPIPAAINFPLIIEVLEQRPPPYFRSELWPDD